MGEPNDNMYFDKPGQYASDVPGMNYDAHLAGPCDNFQIFTFGRGPGGASRCSVTGSPTSGRRCTPGSGWLHRNCTGFRKSAPRALHRKRRHRLPTDAHCCVWVSRAGRPGSSPVTGSSRHSRRRLVRRQFEARRRTPASISVCASTALRVAIGASGRGARSGSARRRGCPPRSARTPRCCTAARAGTGGLRTTRHRYPGPTAAQRNSSAR